MGSALPPRRVPAVSALVREGAARARAQAKTRRSLSLHCTRHNENDAQYVLHVHHNITSLVTSLVTNQLITRLVTSLICLLA